MSSLVASINIRAVRRPCASQTHPTASQLYLQDQPSHSARQSPVTHPESFQQGLVSDHVLSARTPLLAALHGG